MIGGRGAPSVRRMTENPKPHVLIAGGGVAALEALIALHELAGDRVRVTILAPERDFVYRPLAVAEPFSLGHAARRDLAAIAGEFGAELVRDALAQVDGDGGCVVTAAGAEIPYDSLLVAVGATGQKAFRHAITFDADRAQDALAGLLADLEQGYAKHVAFVVPDSQTWSLPLYELAILTARDVWANGIDGVRLTFVTPERKPLGRLDPDTGAQAAAALAREGVEFVGGAQPEVVAGAVLAGGLRIDVDRVVSLPVPVGPSIEGLPEDGGGFIPVDDHARVIGLEGVYAAGDATDAPLKQGGLAAQQALAAAEAIAARHGADVDPQPYRLVVRSALFTDGAQTDKIVSRYLAPYLASHVDEPVL
jgi:sulfide:quinone oxidoreductase